jgi:Rod binding domain-containing protein
MNVLPGSAGVSPASYLTDQAEMAARQAALGGADRVVLDRRLRGCPGDLREAARAAEGLFLGELLREMRKTVEQTGFLDGGLAEDIFTEQWDQQIAGRLAEREQGGIAQALYQQLRPYVTSPAEGNDSGNRQDGGECRHENR